MRRLCQRMGLIESMLPDTIALADEQLKSFLEKTILTEQSRRILDGLTAQKNGERPQITKKPPGAIPGSLGITGADGRI